MKLIWFFFFFLCIIICVIILEQILLILVINMTNQCFFKFSFRACRKKGTQKYLPLVIKIESDCQEWHFSVSCYLICGYFRFILLLHFYSKLESHVYNRPYSLMNSLWLFSRADPFCKLNEDLAQGWEGNVTQLYNPKIVRNLEHKGYLLNFIKLCKCDLSGGVVWDFLVQI